jgi:hypothetical protein
MRKNEKQIPSKQKPGAAAGACKRKKNTREPYSKHLGVPTGCTRWTGPRSDGTLSNCDGDEAQFGFRPHFFKRGWVL